MLVLGWSELLLFPAAAAADPAHPGEDISKMIMVTKKDLWGRMEG
jgi:hypothetical protein